MPWGGLGHNGPVSWIRRKRARLDEPFPEAWRAILDANVVHWSFLSADERARLEDTILWLVVDKRWEAARGFVLTDEVRVTIAAQAALLALGFDEDPYANVGTIIVHPTTMIFTGPRGGAIPGTVVDSPLHALGVATLTQLRRHHAFGTQVTRAAIDELAGPL